jgi:uncharacterized protein YbjT (DUF2867 family)
MPKTALVAGHTGLVGRHLLAQLLDDPRYVRVKAVGRRAPEITHPKLEIIQTDMSALGKLGDRLAADDVFCALGTTMKQAGSKAAFEKVDYHMVVDLARACRAAGATRFFVVSSLSASPSSPVYYSRVKGRTEQALREIGFERLEIIRPSLLIGARDESKPRVGEALAQKVMPLVNPLMRGKFAQYRAIHGSDVAGAMVQLAARDERGTYVRTLPLA